MMRSWQFPRRPGGAAGSVRDARGPMDGKSCYLNTDRTLTSSDDLTEFAAAFGTAGVSLCLSRTARMGSEVMRTRGDGVGEPTPEDPAHVEKTCSTGPERLGYGQRRRTDFCPRGPSRAGPPGTRRPH